MLHGGHCVADTAELSRRTDHVAAKRLFSNTVSQQDIDAIAVEAAAEQMQQVGAALEM